MTSPSSCVRAPTPRHCHFLQSTLPSHDQQSGLSLIGSATCPGCQCFISKAIICSRPVAARPRSCQFAFDSLSRFILNFLKTVVARVKCLKQNAEHFAPVSRSGQENDVFGDFENLLHQCCLDLRVVERWFFLASFLHLGLMRFISSGKQVAKTRHAHQAKKHQPNKKYVRNG